MKIFGQIIGTIVEVAKLPGAILEDVIDPKDTDEKSHSSKQLDKIKDAASEKDNS